MRSATDKRLTAMPPADKPRDLEDAITDCNGACRCAAMVLDHLAYSSGANAPDKDGMAWLGGMLIRTAEAVRGAWEREGKASG